MATTKPSNERTKPGAPSGPVDPAKESVAGEEDPGAALDDDGERSQNDPALRPAPSQPQRKR
jgi:hypothetical protein